MELHDLVKQYPELGEALAEIENRLSVLEGSGKPYSYYDDVEKRLAGLEQRQNPDFVAKLAREELEGIKARLNHLYNKLNEHIDAKKQPGKKGQPLKAIEL